MKAKAMYFVSFPPRLAENEMKALDICPLELNFNVTTIKC